MKAKVFKSAIVTRVDELKGFYPAEGYHQDFLINNPTNPYIVRNDVPKVQNLMKVFPSQYRGQPVTVRKLKSSCTNSSGRSLNSLNRALPNT